MGEAAEGSEGSVDDPAAGRGLGAGRAGRQHARHRRVLHQFRQRLHRRVVDVPPSTGYGEPVQSLFKFKDGERVVAAASLDPRFAPSIKAKKEGDVPPTHAVAVTSDGYSLRFGLEPFVEVSTRAGQAVCARRTGSRGGGRCRSCRAARF